MVMRGLTLTPEQKKHLPEPGSASPPSSSP